MKGILILTTPLFLAACVSAPATQGNWSCRAVGNQTCATIAQIDNGDVPGAKSVQKQGAPQTTIFGGRVAPWWDRNTPTAVTQEDAPHREYDQTMRVLVAPYIDAQGDYHDRGVVYAVMRKANWWIVPPVPAASEPRPGTRVDQQPSSASTGSSGAEGAPSAPALSSSSSSSSVAATPPAHTGK